MFQQLKRAFVRSHAFQASIVAVGTAVAAPGAFAQAALPTGVDAAITDAGEMLVLGGTAVVIAIVGFWAIKKLGGKMGWW
jgi:hypothetical protein